MTVKDTTMITKALIEYDRAFGGVVGGADEAGRGPLAGPVVCAAVIMPLDEMIQGIRDSKKVSEKAREYLYDIIIERAAEYRIVVIEPRVIDTINILRASIEGMRQAIDKLSHPTDIMLVDGNAKVAAGRITESVVRGDGTSYNIAAASILAKVTRDRIMRNYDIEYPGYGFGSHKGYPTKAHYKVIDNLGISDIHRRSFLTKRIADMPYTD